MYTLKDKVAGGLSRLFSESPNHCSASSTSDLSEAGWYSKGSKSLSSMFSFIIPPVSFGGTKPKNHRSDLKPIQSLPVRWKNKKFEVEDESLDSCKEYTITYTSEDVKKICEDKKKVPTDSNTKLTVRPHVEEKGHASEKSSSDTDEFQEAREQASPVKPSPNLSDESVFITPHLYEFLDSSLPNIVKGCQWVLLYSTLKHGISLRTLIRKSAELPGPCLLITGDRQGAIFGAMLECPLIPTPKRKYQGTNRTFVFTTIYALGIHACLAILKLKEG
ncbi:TLDc [Corchorus olitorius]|uniref:TLDc n=1 Tax=Corchorus olitorius TaxID=93759 RepID=A0A1R3JKM5_9ROSI|nr:TLDc [Corchorus olitorius]